jgi:hypothetical protein
VRAIELAESVEEAVVLLLIERCIQQWDASMLYGDGDKKIQQVAERQTRGCTPVTARCT